MEKIMERYKKQTNKSNNRFKVADNETDLLDNFIASKMETKERLAERQVQEQAETQIQKQVEKTIKGLLDQK